MKYLKFSVMTLVFLIICTSCAKDYVERKKDQEDQIISSKDNQDGDLNEIIVADKPEGSDIANTASDIELDDNSNEFTYHLVPVDRSKIVIEEIEPEIPNSYAVTQRQTYEKWERNYEVYYPKFTDEIEFDGVEIIKQYYADLAKAEKDKMENYMKSGGGIGDTLEDRSYDLGHYYYQTYNVEFYGHYLSVLYYGTGYTGGVHPYHICWIDNFDMNTGKLLTMEDLFGDKQNYAPVINAVIGKYLMDEKDRLFSNVHFDENNVYDFLGAWENIPFRITKNGIGFYFNEYVISPYASGGIEVNIPYEDLEAILKIKI